MPTTPLGAAILGDNEQGLGYMDPNLLQALPDIKLGQSMQQGSLSTAPAYPAQAFARLADAIAGSYIQHQALSDLGKTYADTPAEVAKILRQTQPGNPVIPMLESKDAPTRMLGMQLANKTVPLQAETHEVNPTQTMMTGGGRAVGQGSPALGGAAAGAEAAAKAPYEPGGDATIQTPSGPQSVPITAEQRRGLLPAITGQQQVPLSPPRVQQQLPLSPPKVAPTLSAVPKGTSASPSAAIPPPEPKPAPGDTVPMQGGIPGSPPTNMAAQSAILGSPAVGTLGGKPLPNPAIDAAVKADTEEVAKDREAASKGQQEMATIRAIQDFAPKVKTGWSADTKLEGARILKGMGASDDQIKDFLNTDVAAGQILQKKFVELSAAAARNMGAREPGSVIQMFAKAYPNLGTDPQAIALQTNALYMDRLRSQNLAQQKTNYLNDSINGVQSTGQYRGLKGFNEQFNKSNPAEYYLHAAEAMSGMPEAWKVKDPTNRIPNITIGYIPPGTKYLGPDGQMHIKPGAAQ